MNKPKIVILDGNSLLYRAFYAIPELTTKEGIHTNGVYGFLNMFFKIKQEINPDYIITAFDKSKKTFRHDEYEDYKAGRKKTPPELVMQFPIIRDALNKMGINIFEIDGYEADDLIGTISLMGEEKDMEVYVVTGDKDALQLASDNVKVVINKKGITETEIYDKNRFIEEFGVTPTQYIDVKGLMGDKSDNIPGVPGIGDKTAFKLIKEYGSVEGVLENIPSISGKKLKESLMEYSEQAILSKRLSTIVRHVPIDISEEDLMVKGTFNYRQVKELFLKLQFKSLLDKIDREYAEEIAENKEESKLVEYTSINTIEDFEKIISTIKDNLFIKIYTNGDHTFSGISIVKIGINIDGKVFLIDFNEITKNSEVKFIELLKRILENKEISKITHEAKQAYTCLYKLGIDLNTVQFDCEIAAYLLDSSQSDYTIKNILSKEVGKDFSGEGDELIANEVYFLPAIYEVLDKSIKEENMEYLLFNVEQPLTKAISQMECEGFNINKQELENLATKFKEEITTITQEIYNLAGEEFNINSPKQLGKILFEKLDLPVVKKTKTGYSTNAEVLETLKDKHEIIEKILYYRQISKLNSTYVEGLKNVIDSDGRIHSNFTQTVTTTGRLSSTEPNLQNIPIKYENGRAIRKVFVPHNEDSVILSADYSQIELRVLAHISGDENLIKAFNSSKDIHTSTASEVFGVPIDQVTKTMRSNAKAVNFGIVYGIGDFSLAQDLGITRKEAKEYIDAYLDRYKKVKDYMENVIEEGEKNSYVTTLLNRRRFIPEIKSSNKILKALGKRLAMNAPIQGTAADIIKLAMVNVNNKIRENKLKSSLILQVHDELILNVYKQELEDVKKLIKEEMENALELKVPLEVEISTGDTWYEAK